MRITESKLRSIIRQVLINEMPDLMMPGGPGEESPRELTDEEKLNHAWNKTQHAEHDQEKRALGREFEMMKNRILKKKRDAGSSADASKWFSNWQKSHRKKMSRKDLKAATGWSPKKDDGETQESRFLKPIVKKYMSMLDNKFSNYMLDFVKQYDVSGVLTWPDVKRAHDEYKKDPSDINQLQLAVTFVGAFPMLGTGKGGVKLADALMNKKSLNMLKKASRQNLSGRLTDNKVLMQALESMGKNNKQGMQTVKDALKAIDDKDVLRQMKIIKHATSGAKNTALQDVLDAYEKSR